MYAPRTVKISTATTEPLSPFLLQWYGQAAWYDYSTESLVTSGASKMELEWDSGEEKLCCSLWPSEGAQEDTGVPKVTARYTE